MNLKNNDIRQLLKTRKIITDGAFGTYFSRKYDTVSLPEKSNTLEPKRVIDIHSEYIKAGAVLLRTNTFASNTISLECDKKQLVLNIKAAVLNAFEAVKKAEEEKTREIFIAGDIGPIPNDNMFDRECIIEEYKLIASTMLDAGINVFVFETFSDLELIRPAIEMIGDRGFIIVQFSVNQFGYSSAGLSARKLVEEADNESCIDAIGFNCGIGPGHMHKLIEGLIGRTDKYFTALPNAGYPQIVSNRMVFDDKNMNYFCEKMNDIAKQGVSIIGGCCGTTPEYIRSLKEMIDIDNSSRSSVIHKTDNNVVNITDNSFFKDKEGKKLIAVELAPPANTDDEKLMDAAFSLKKSGVDVLTFPDSPSGRTRADSILMAEKVSRETGMCVMPHICCRDKNAIAIRSQMLGAHINKIYNYLVITGDPIPSVVRSQVKSVFNFDAVGLMNIIQDMNEEQFEQAPMFYGGAINQGRKNLQVEITRVKKKMAAGASFFLTQPVFSEDDIDRLRIIKNETKARILCGIMPLVSLKNALFMKNEMTGINVTDEILLRYNENMTKSEGEMTGIKIAREIIEKTKDFADGYYFSFPFNRVYMLGQILNGINL